jgi:hypothetical protein
MARICASCGATNQEATFPGTRKPSRRRDYCCDCTGGAMAETRIAARRAEIAAGDKPRSRRSYRAALKHRASSPQLDLVDLLVGSP